MNDTGRTSNATILVTCYEGYALPNGDVSQAVECAAVPGSCLAEWTDVIECEG